MNSSIASIFNIILLNILFFYNKKIVKKKTIFFYHPKISLIKIHDYYIKDLFDKIKDNYKLIYGLQPSSNFKSNFESIFYINQGYLKYIFNVDIFINLNIVDIFPKNSKKVYIHHSIYDTPLASKNKDKELAKRLAKYNYILLSSKDAQNVFDKLFLNRDLNKPKILIIGYLKLDYLKKRNNKLKVQNKIVIAPTGIRSFPNLSIQKYLFNLIKELLKLRRYLVVYRPHPSDFYNNDVLKIDHLFRLNKYFIFDRSSNYDYHYRTSKLLITDLSGTSYTYALLTNNPVIFFSKKESYISKKTYYKKLNFFKNRTKIGEILKDENKLLYTLKKMEKKRNIYKKNINVIRKNIKNRGTTKNKLLKFIYSLEN